MTGHRSAPGGPLPPQRADARQAAAVPEAKAFPMKTITQWQLRAEFTSRMSRMYGREVPAYAALVDVSREVNEHVLHRAGADAERLGRPEGSGGYL
jgi:hypothetical protein